VRLLCSAVLSLSSSGARRILHSSLHDALPILDGNGFEDLYPGILESPYIISPDLGMACVIVYGSSFLDTTREPSPHQTMPSNDQDRKSTRLNSSHVKISYAVFCLNKKNTQHPE